MTRRSGDGQLSVTCKESTGSYVLLVDLIDDIVTAVKAHEKNPAVHERACNLLSVMMADDKSGQATIVQTIVQVGGTGAVVHGCMRTKRISEYKHRVPEHFDILREETGLLWTNLMVSVRSEMWKLCSPIRVRRFVP